MFNPLNKIKHPISYVYRNIVYPRILTRRYKDVLDKNIEIKDVYNGKRCFILGNGPSMNNVDLDKLKDEFVFVVNNFDRHPQFHKLQHVHHVIPDDWNFVKDKTTYFWERVKNQSDNADPKTIFFSHVKGKDLVEKEDLFVKNKIYYLSIQGIISDHFDFNIDLDKTLPWTKNSILLCLIIAVYMGFREIYLLGCEHSYLVKNVGGQGKPITLNHFYINEELERLLETKDKNAEETLQNRYGWGRGIVHTYEGLIVQILQLFKNYRLFYEKVKNKYPDIKIFNATPNSFLDVFPFVDYDEIVK